MNKPRYPRVLKQGAIVACLVGAFLAACGSERPGQLGGGDDPLPWPDGGIWSGPCAEGATRACDKIVGQHPGYVDCFYGTQACTGGQWGPCQGDASGGSVSAKAYSGPIESGGSLGIQALSEAGAQGAPCSQDPCDPYCIGYNENPPMPITPSPNPQQCGMTSTGTNAGCSGGANKDIGTGTCTTNADCEMDWHCSAGACVWNGGSGYYDPGCKDSSGNPGIDLTLGVPCGDPASNYNIPVCNRGGGTLAAGKVVTLENDGNGSTASWNCATQPNPSTSSGAASCTYTLASPLGPGQCVIINTLTTPGCAVLETGERYLYVNWDKSITECGTGFSGSGAGCMNNASHTKATGTGCAPACGTPTATAYTQLYSTYCPAGTRGQWNLLSYNVTATSGADVKFAIQTGSSPTGPWNQPTPLQVADAPIDHPNNCSMTGPSPCGGSYAASCSCPIDLFTPLGKASAQQPYLLLTTNLAAATCATATPVVNIYGHTATSLYSVNPVTYAVTKIGDFKDTSGNVINEMTDLALDSNSNMYGVTFTDLYKINYSGNPVVCTHLGSLSTNFNGLTFVPASLMGTANEVLIGNSNDGGWWQINLSPVTITRLGYYGGSANVIGSSGDSVGIIGDRVYATVTGLSGSSDHLITVNPKTGAMVSDLGSTGQTGLWGLGYWGGSAYAFSDAGKIFTINLSNATVTQVSTGGPAWWGAAVTTSVNVTPPAGSSGLNSWQLSFDCVPSE